MSTIHNPVNFEPSNYEIEDYLDNRRPQYYGQGVEAFVEEVKWWEADMERALGADWRRKCHHCIHCGNGNVRWITAVRYLPTNEVVVFGCDCTERLGFQSHLAFKLAQLKAKAEAGHARLKVWKAREAFVEARPELKAAIEEAKLEVHAGNTFVKDVLNKLNTWGSLSDRQVAAVVASLKRDHEFAARKAAEVVEVKGPAPKGRQTVTGLVLSVKLQEGYYGVTEKMLLKLENGSRVWLTSPSKASIEKGDTVTVTATFEPKAEDLSFAYGKRPHLVTVVHPAEAVVVAA